MRDRPILFRWVLPFVFYAGAVVFLACAVANGRPQGSDYGYVKDSHGWTVTDGDKRLFHAPYPSSAGPVGKTDENVKPEFERNLMELAAVSVCLEDYVAQLKEGREAISPEVLSERVRQEFLEKAESPAKERIDFGLLVTTMCQDRNSRPYLEEQLESLVLGQQSLGRLERKKALAEFAQAWLEKKLPGNTTVEESNNFVDGDWGNASRAVMEAAMNTYAEGRGAELQACFEEFISSGTQGGSE